VNTLLTTPTKRSSASDSVERVRDHRRNHPQGSVDTFGRITAKMRAVAVVTSAIHRIFVASTARPRPTRRKYPSRHELFQPSRMERERYRL
jgi:hypothetical protein